MGMGVARIDRECAPITCYGAVRVALYVAKIAEIHVRLREPGLDAGRLLEGARRALEIAAALVEHAEIVVAFRVLRIELEEPSVAFAGPFELAVSGQLHALLKERVYRGRFLRPGGGPRSAAHAGHDLPDQACQGAHARDRDW